MKLSECSKGRENNLNLIRLTAAVMVIFCHAFPISLGASHADPMYSFLTRGQLSFGNLAVCIFFFFGGFLIMGSCERSHSGKNFYKKRIKRLFPSLAVVVLISAFIMGPVLTKNNVLEYFTNVDVYKYLLNAVLIPVHNLPGVFMKNVHNPTVNGPLWTLPVEFICYIICFAMYRMNLTDEKKLKYSILFFILGYAAMYLLLARIPLLQEALRPMGMFYVGMVYYVYRDRIELNGKILSIMIILLCFSAYFKFMEFTILIALPYILAYIGFAIKKNYHFLDGKPDISYQMYLIAWPIQQILCQCSGGSMNPWINAACTIPICVAGAAVLYECVDKRINLK